QVAREVPQGILQSLVTTEQPVVAHDRRNGHEQAERRHDERLTDWARDLVDARLASDTDTDEGVQNAPHGAEQTNERSDGADRGQKAQTALQLAVHLVDRTL